MICTFSFLFFFFLSFFFLHLRVILVQTVTGKSLCRWLDFLITGFTCRTALSTSHCDGKRRLQTSPLKQLSIFAHRDISPLSPPSPPPFFPISFATLSCCLRIYTQNVQFSQSQYNMPTQFLFSSSLLPFKTTVIASPPPPPPPPQKKTN